MKAFDAEDDPAYARRVQRIGAQRGPTGPPTPEQQAQSAMAIEREIARAVAAVEKLEARAPTWRSVRQRAGARQRWA